MNYRHLQYFARVVQTGSIKGAAEEIGVSQPTVSAAVRKLEEEFGATLLDRRREGSVPTEYGRYLYETATTMNNVVQNTLDRIASLKDPSTGTLRVGTGPSVSTEHAAMALSRVMEQYPRVRITHVARGSYTTFEQLLTVDDIDVAICHFPEQSLPDSLRHQLISTNPIGAFVSSAHFPSDATSVSAGEVMNNFNWITPRDDEIRPPTGVSISSGGRQGGPSAASLAEDLQLIKHLTLTTRSVGFLPMHMVADELQSGDFVELVREGSTVHRPVYALTRIGQEKPALINAFLDALTAVFSDLDRSSAPHRTIDLVN